MIAIAYTIAHADDPARDLRRRVGPDEPWDVYVLNGRGRVYQTSGAGEFSLKWMARGRARYAVDRRAHAVACDRAILLDNGQPYDLEFDASEPSESYCIFFSPRLVAEAWASIDAGFSDAATPVTPQPFPTVPFAPSHRLTSRLRALHTMGVDAGAVQLEAQLLDVLEEAVATAQRHRRLVAKVPAAKPATRAHLVALVERARGVLDDADGTGWTLAALATEVGLSKFHLLRLFRALHGVTPMEYAERTRMRAAAALLRASDCEVGEIATRFGYESASAFAKAFRRFAGAAPRSWRNVSIDARGVTTN